MEILDSTPPKKQFFKRGLRRQLMKGKYAGREKNPPILPCKWSGKNGPCFLSSLHLLPSSALSNSQAIVQSTNPPNANFKIKVKL